MTKSPLLRVFLAFTGKARLAQGARTGLRVQLPIKALRESKLLIIRKRLISKHQHTVLIHPASNRFQGLVVVNLAQIDGADFRGKGRV